jgi:20S proteasome alpha/beta subunit
MTKDEALKLALEALTYIHSETSTEEDALIDEAIIAIEEALAQPTQETEK